MLSKLPEMFLPEQWPSYYAKTRGVEVVDLGDNVYMDMNLMGVGACVLGYADPGVDSAVKNAIDNGSMCTLNAPESDTQISTLIFADFLFFFLVLSALIASLRWQRRLCYEASVYLRAIFP